MKQKLNLMLSVLMLGALAIGGTQAIGAQSALRSSTCPEPSNWCGAGPGQGDTDCNNCCNIASGEELGGLCTFYEPGEAQGCLCW